MTTRRSHDRQTRQRPRQRRRTHRRRRRRTSACRGRPTPAPASHLSLLPGGRTYLGFENLAQGVHRCSNLETTQLKFDQSCVDSHQQARSCCPSSVRRLYQPQELNKGRPGLKVEADQRRISSTPPAVLHFCSRN